jgi:glycosyltransferase involved in cell wall biosynthesis
MPDVTVHVVRKAPPVIRQLVSGAGARRFLRRFRPDIVHVHYLSPGPRVLWPLGFGRLVVTPYGTDVEAMPAGMRGVVARRIAGAVLRRAVAVVAASRHLLDATRRTGLMRASSLEAVIGFGVDCDRFLCAPTRKTARGAPVVVGYAKGLRDYYGPLDLVEAVHLVRERGRDVRLRLAGRGPLEPELRTAVTHNALSRHVELVGQLSEDQLPGFFAGIDIFAMPSHREAYGVAALEAAASCRPVVASRVGGIPEVVRDGETGLLVPPHDPHRLAGAIERLAADAQLRHEMGEAGRRFVLEHHSRIEAVSRMLELYREVLAA